MINSDGHPVGAQRLCINPRLVCAWRMVEVLTPGWVWRKGQLFPDFVLSHLPKASTRGGVPIMSDGDEGHLIQVVRFDGRLAAAASRFLIKPEPDPLSEQDLAKLTPLTVAKGEPVA